MLSPSEPSLPALVWLVCLSIFDFVKISFISVYGYVYVDICVCTFRCLQRPDETVGSPGARVTGGCEILGMGAGVQILNTSMYS